MELYARVRRAVHVEGRSQREVAREFGLARSFLRCGGVWTTDKDGIVPYLLSAEITVRVAKDPGQIWFRFLIKASLRA